MASTTLRVYRPLYRPHRRVERWTPERGRQLRREASWRLPPVVGHLSRCPAGRDPIYRCTCGGVDDG
jgi:hypothetical protein